VRNWPWHIIGSVTVGALALGSCAGAAVGRYTVTGRMSSTLIWEMPRQGAEQAVADIAIAPAPRQAQKPQPVVGYYPAYGTADANPIDADYRDTSVDDIDQLWDAAEAADRAAAQHIDAARRELARYDAGAVGLD
jgi:hypothetical protein